ncbi:MAG: putative aminotransferase [Nitrospirae bacterium]|nr:MAG: putative aminotransferase [Nitrospirota bacterium]
MADVQMTIPPVDPKADYLAHKEEIDAAVRRVMERGQYILGEEVGLFESEFSGYIGAGFGIGVGSGTEALHVALMACGMGDGDEVITVSHTAVATVAAIEMCNAVPVFVDIDQNSYTIDPEHIEMAVSKKTRAIVPVHLYGHPADMASVTDIAKRHGLRVIEDCAQSHGASYRGHMTGSLGDIAAFSFYPTKNLGALGDGGMVVTGDPALAEKVRLLRQYGWRQRYISEIQGINSRLDEIQAAVLRVKLRYLDEAIQRRRVLAGIYDKAFAGSGVVCPKAASDSEHAYHLYVIRISGRDGLRDFLRKQGIGTLIHYPVPVHDQPAYRGRIKCSGDMRNTEKAAGEIVSLPMYPGLSSASVQKVADAVLEWSRRSGS